jgi:poly(A) polymerase
MPELHENSHVRTFLPLLKASCAGRECFLVGGAIRDWLMNRDVSDFDFATPYDPTDLSLKFSQALNGHWFILDKKRHQTRVSVKIGTQRLTFDFAPFRAATLAGDLALRDYTLNSLALSVDDAWCQENIIDLHGGGQDLAARILRITSETVLRSDPLRILKGIRHCLELGLHLEPDTLLSMTQAVPELRHVAVERIRQEMVRILSFPCETGFCVSLLMESGVGRFFWGEHFTHSDSRLVHAQFRSLQFWKIIAGIPLNLVDVLNEPVEEGLCRRALLQWVFLLGTLSPDCALETARSWRFSRQALRRIEAVSQLNDEVWPDFQRAGNHRRALLLWAEQYGPDPVDLLLAMAFALDNTPAVSIEKILQPLALVLEGDPPWQVDDLVDGHFLKRECGLHDGKEIGQILAALRQAEAYGQIEGQSQAEQFAVALCNKKD